MYQKLVMLWALHSGPLLIASLYKLCISKESMLFAPDDIDTLNISAKISRIFT